MLETTEERKTDWAKWATIVSSAAAAGGLAVTAVLGYYQFREAQEANDRKVSEQARQVVTWVEGGKTDKKGVEIATAVVANRSKDPVTSATVFIPGRYYGFGYQEEQEIRLGAIPPCSRVEVRFQLAVDGKGAKLSFLDSAGKGWNRNDFGALHEGALETKTSPSQQSEHPVKEIEGCAG
ncbi:hypothetical protein [Streptomyces chartreusis]|uniref:hypothetical protein n=1 Tax=Streptomyces chartreusis TaxID=1969 RepID=UPI0033A2C475